MFSITYLKKYNYGITVLVFTNDNLIKTNTVKRGHETE